MNRPLSLLPAALLLAVAGSLCHAAAAQSARSPLPAPAAPIDALRLQSTAMLDSRQLHADAGVQSAGPSSPATAPAPAPAPATAPATAATAAPELVPATAAATDTLRLQGTVVLDPRLLVHAAVARSAEIAYSRLQVDVASELSQAEAALYETVLFGNVRRENRDRQRTVEERLSNIAAARLAVLEERVDTTELGVRNRLPTGGEVSLSYRLRDRSNNIIANSSVSPTEYDGAMVLSLKQPLLRGRGPGVTETDRRVAEIEQRISQLQFRQQLLKTSSDALALYWQLYRALEVQRVREQSLDAALRIQADTAARIEAGRLPEANSKEARAAVVLREVERLRSEQGVKEAQSRLATLLGFSAIAEPDVNLLTRSDPPALPAPLPLRERYQKALDQWPAFGIARLRGEQAALRLDYAANQRLPALDLQLSRSNTGLATDRGMARSLTESSKYPEWYVGISLEMPLGGNQKAQSQYRAQAARVRQSTLELESITHALANDIQNRHEQALAAVAEVQKMRVDAGLRDELFEIEKVRYQSGMGLLHQLLQRETELIESRQRLVESLARLGQARDGLLFADGSLLQAYGVTLKE